MDEVNVTELRQNLQSHLGRVSRGERLQVTHRGRVVAQIIPAVSAAEFLAPAGARLASRSPPPCAAAKLVLTMPLPDWLADVRSLPEVRFEPASADMAQRAGLLGDEWHGDPADRLIAATALTLGASLVSADAKPKAAPGLKTVW